ncbi:MAG: response regulator transcription factor [Cytophagales bacterium]|nr:response regulator transcription factor [Cytophagales bacterium]
MKLQIGIVDDKRYLRQLLAEKINQSSEARVVLLAENGEDFLKKLKELPQSERPAIVLMDLEMPVMNGIEAVGLAKAAFPDIEYLILTVFDEDEKIFDALKAGASGYLLKDESFENILDSMLQVLQDGGVPMSPRIARKVLAMLRAVKMEKEETAKAETNLTARELEILELIVKGLNYQEIAAKLVISPNTVRKHIQNTYQKLHVTTKLGAVKVAMTKRLF